MNASPSCLDCGHALPIIFGRTSQHAECLHCGSAFVVVFSGPECFQIVRAERIPKGLLFHVRFMENGVEQEQIFAGVPDGKGDFNINLPTPCTLLSVKQHGFPWCEVCDAQVNADAPLLSEHESMDHHHDLSEFESQVRGYVERYVQPLLETDRAARIRAEVEAMDWPEVIDA